MLLAFAVMVADADTDLVADVVEPGFGADLHEVIGRLVDASLLQVRSAVSTTRCQLLRTVAVHTLESAERRRRCATARVRYIDAVLERVASVVPRLASPERPDALRELDSDMPHVRAVFGELCVPSADPPRRNSGARHRDAAHRLLARTPAGRGPGVAHQVGRRRPTRRRGCGPKLCCAADISPTGSPTLLAATRWRRTPATLFHDLGDSLGEGQALRRLGAIAAATDDLADGADHCSRSRCAGSRRPASRPRSGITLLHLGSLLADEGDVDAALPALQRALTIAADSDNPLAGGQALAALAPRAVEGRRTWKQRSDPGRTRCNSSVSSAITPWKAPSRTASPRSPGDWDSPMSHGRMRSLRSTPARPPGRGPPSRSATSISLAWTSTQMRRAMRGHTLARHSRSSIRVADRWVLVEALEVARAAPVGGGPAEAAELLHAATAIRAEIRQPVPPTDAAELERTRARVDALGLRRRHGRLRRRSRHPRACDVAIHEGVHGQTV